MTAQSDDRGTGTARFFALAFAITWSLQTPAVLAQLGLIAGPVERFMPLAGLGAFGPLLAAVLTARVAAGGAGVRALFARLWIGGFGPQWFVVALALPAAIFAAGMAVFTLAGGSGPWFYPPMDGQRVAAMIVFPIGEEVGWRGLALPRLQARHSRLAASLLVGVGWALWHIPMFLLAGMPGWIFAVAMVSMVAGSVMFSWLFNHTGGSLLLAILLHVGAHLCGTLQALPDGVPFMIDTAALLVFAALLVLVDRKAWRSAS